MSSASPPRNSSSDPRLLSAGAPHESASPASNLARASARTLVLCLPLVRMQYGGAIQTLRCAAPRSFSLRPATEPQALSPQRQTHKRSRPAHPVTNPIVPRGGFLQVAVSEAPIYSASEREIFPPGRFRYSTKRGPPRWGGYVTLKLCQSSMAWYNRGLCAVRISVTTWPGS